MTPEEKANGCEHRCLFGEHSRLAARGDVLRDARMAQLIQTQTYVDGCAGLNSFWEFDERVD